jgi:ABC-type uncharacterized transport system ATPase subunit
MTVAIEFRNLRKCFPGVVANDDVSLSVNAGEVMALVGENGAGKTTLVNTIYGMHRPDSGEILVNGLKADLHSPADAIALGIGMVHQHFMLVPPLTVAENVVLGNEPVKCGFVLDRKLIHAKVAELAKRFGLSVDPAETVERLPVGIQQRVEILKALYRGAETLVLDEPTAVLTPQESRELFKTIALFKSQGKTVIFISHKLGDVLAIADRIAVMRSGRLVTVADAAQTGKAELARLMMGVERPVGGRSSVPLVAPETRGDGSGIILDVANLRARNDRGVIALNDVSFSAWPGSRETGRRNSSRCSRACGVSFPARFQSAAGPFRNSRRDSRGD